MSQPTSQQMDFVTLGDDLDFTSFCENLQNPFEPDIFCVSPNQTVPSVSPDGSPSPYSSDNPDFYYLNEDSLFGSLDDVCPLPIPPVDPNFSIKSEQLKDPKPQVLTKSPVIGKKRARKSATHSSKSAKLDFQTKTLEEYQQQLESGRTLTIEEERLLKKQRRLIKNRESAQLSRQRKKQYIVDLENKVKMMDSENEKLRLQVAQMNNRNVDLENQVAQLKSMMNSIPVKHPKAALGLCMVVFLLSLGVFFPQNSSSGPSTSDYSHPPSVYTGRVLQEVARAEVSELGKQETELSILEKRQVRDHFLDENPLKRPKLEVSDGGDERYPYEEEDSLSSSYGLMLVDPKSSKPSLEQSREQEIKPPTESSSYIYCSEAHPLQVSSAPPSTDAPPVVTLLLPASALNGTIPQMEYFLDEPENSLLEVSCQILNITVYPFYPGVDGRLDFPPMIDSI